MVRVDTVPEALRAFFDAHPKLALAFSGGVDSAYLLYAAVECGCDVHAFYAQSVFQPAFEREDARRLAEQLGAKMTIVPLDVLAVEAVRQNPENRCYHCKRAIFGALLCAFLWKPMGQKGAMLVCVAAVLLIRLLAAHYRWSLPKATE